MKIWVEHTPEELAAATAGYIAEIIRQHPNALMCFAAGDTPLQMLAKLVEMQSRGEVDLSSVYYVGLDEWQGLGYQTKGSCCQVMRDHFYTPADIPEERMLLWDGLTADPQADCGRIDRFIEKCGGIFLTLLGIGMNGHIGFNEPGAPLDQNCMIVGLDAVTAQVGKKYFGGAACPGKGMTIGMPRLLEAKEAMLMATGAHKAPIVRKSVMEKPSIAVPASQMQAHPRLTVCLDMDVWQNL